MNKQRGVALIIVLMLLAIMATVAGSMSERLFLQFQRATNQTNYQQAYWYSIGIEALAKMGITQSYRDSETINLSQPWAITDQVYPLDYGIASGQINDMQACFNLNVFANVPQSDQPNMRPYVVGILQRLLEELEVEPYQAEVIADSVWEFVDSNDTAQSMTGVEDSTYESMSPSYVASNYRMADSSEFRAIYQVSGEVYHNVSPYLCALPSDDFRLNVNTISTEMAPLLVAMFSPALSIEDATSLIEDRRFDGWDSIDDFLSEPQIASINGDIRDNARGYLGVDSAFFELEAEVLVGESRVRIRSLLHSENRENVTVVRRRFGGISERESSRSTE